jgi:hypothetical protein
VEKSKESKMNIARIITIPLWVAGVVIAKGFWSTFFALIIPFYAWYLSIEALMVKFGVL